MKILQSLPFYPPATGGVENQVYHLVKNLKEMGNLPIVVTSGHSEKSSEFCDVLRLPSIYLKGTWGNLAISPTILQALKGIKVDVVHAHTPARFFAESTAFFFKFVRKGTPVVLSYHQHNENLGLISNVVMNFHNKTVMTYLFNHVDKIIVPSCAYKRIVESYYRINGDKITVIPCGIDTETFNPLRFNVETQRERFGILNENVVLFVGRLVSYKGLEYLLNAMPLVIREFKDTVLVIVGEGNIRNELENLTKKLRLQEHVRFLGSLPSDQIPEIMSMASVFVLPSLVESFGVVLAEALSMEKPVIASNVGGIPEVVEKGKTGLLVSRQDVKGLSEAIISVLSDQNWAMAMAIEGRKTVVRKFSWQSVTAKTIGIYNKAMNR
ncbi:MAG: glycosyltransferase family 4 protein [Candidatus Bathyarchaeia archaeon]